MPHDDPIIPITVHFFVEFKKLMDGMGPAATPMFHHSLARNGNVLPENFIRENVAIIFRFLGQLAHHLRAGLQDVIGIAPENVFAGRHIETLLARRCEIIEMFPIGVIGCVNVIGGASQDVEIAGELMGNVQRGVGFLVPDCAHDADFIGDQREGFETALDIFFDVARDEAERNLRLCAFA